MKNEIGAKEKVDQIKKNMIILGSLNQVIVSEQFNDDLMKKIKPALDEAGIEIPYPHRVITSKNIA